MTTTAADTTGAVRRSPMHEAISHLNPVLVTIHGMLIASHFGELAAERVQAKKLAICDVSAFPRMVLKGSGVAGWMASQGIEVPAKVYGHLTFDSGNSRIIRTGSTELLIEDAVAGTTVPRLLGDMDSSLAGIYGSRRRDAVIYLSGQQAIDVFAETCGYNFREPDADLVFTRVAGVSCGMLTLDQFPFPVYQVWCDGSFGDYLWEQLHGICCEKGGAAVGLEAFLHA